MTAADLYAEWAPHYPPHAHNPLMEVEQAAVCALLPPLKGAVVLDAGCGTGRYARILQARGARTVIGIDRSPAMLRRAGRGWPRAIADAVALPLADAAMDAIVCGLALPDVADMVPVVREFARVLRPGGVLVTSTLHPVGATLGWTRTYATPRGTRSLPAHWHDLDAHRRACARAGLTTEIVREPMLGAGAAATRVALVVRARRN